MYSRTAGAGVCCRNIFSDRALIVAVPAAQGLELPSPALVQAKELRPAGSL